MTDAAAATPAPEPNAAPDGDAADLAALKGLSPKAEPPAPANDGADEPANDAEPAKEEPAAEPEKPKESVPRLMAKALEIQDKANAKLDEAKKLVAAAESRERSLAEREAKLAEREKTDLDIGAAIKKDPISAFARLGFSPHDLARWCMEDEAGKEARLREEERSRVDSEREKKLAELEKWKEQQEQERMRAAEGDFKSRFVSLVDRDADKYPDIAAEDPDELGAICWDLAGQHFRATGQVPTFEQIAEYLQRAAAEKRAKREERLKKRSSPLASTSSSEKSTPRESGQPASPGPRSPTTLSNAAATERASGPRELTQEQLDEECRKELAGLWG